MFTARYELTSTFTSKGPRTAYSQSYASA